MIKKVALLLFFCIIVAPTWAQDDRDEMLISGPIESGGFGGPVLKATTINDEFGLLAGGRGGWIINHTFVIGGGGYGLTSNIEVKADPLKRYLEFGYGGLELEFVVASRNLIHFSIQTLIGGGGVSYRNRYYEDDFDGSDDSFFVAEPGINAILNVTKNFRIGFGGSYRFVSGIDLRTLNNSDLSGPSAVLTFKFGHF